MLIAIENAEIASTTVITVPPTEAMSAKMSVVSIVMAANALLAIARNITNNVDRTFL